MTPPPVLANDAIDSTNPLIASARSLLGSWRLYSRCLSSWRFSATSCSTSSTVNSPKRLPRIVGIWQGSSWWGPWGDASSPVDARLIAQRELSSSVGLLLIPLDYSLPTLQAYLGARGDKPLDAAEVCRLLLNYWSGAPGRGRR